LSGHRRLPAPVQLPAVAIAGGRVIAAGGLSGADTSVATLARVAPGAPRALGSLPLAVHDAAAAALGGAVYAFGGGTASGSTSAIFRVAGDGRASTAGRLPVGASDLAAASIAGTAYVVGGFTGTVPLRSVLAFEPGAPLRDVATLPHPLRYAAV